MAKQKTATIDDLLQDCVSLNNQIAGLQLLLKQKKDKITEFMKASGETKLKSEGITCYVQERTKVNYNTKKMRDELPKEMLKQFIKRDAKIYDTKLFLKQLAASGIPSSTFKDSVEFNYVVDENALSKAYEKGTITLEDLEGYYEAETTKTVAFRFTAEQPSFKT